MFSPRRIIVHCSATKDSGTVSWNAMRRFHIDVRQWSDIAYHAGVELVGEVYEAMYGRPTTTIGAHTSGHNGDSLGICFVGDYDLVAPPEEMLVVGVRRVILPWCKTFGIAPSAIHGHREFATKTCPGKLFDLEKLRALVAAGL